MINVGMREGMDETQVCGRDWIPPQKKTGWSALWLGYQATELKEKELIKFLRELNHQSDWKSHQECISIIRPSFSSPNPLNRKEAVPKQGTLPHAHLSNAQGRHGHGSCHHSSPSLNMELSGLQNKNFS